MKIKSQSAQEGTARGENMDTNVFFRLGVVRRRAQGIVIRASLLAIAATVFTFATARCHASTEQNPIINYATEGDTPLISVILAKF